MDAVLRDHWLHSTVAEVYEQHTSVSYVRGDEHDAASVAVIEAVSNSLAHDWTGISSVYTIKRRPWRQGKHC